MTTSAKVLGAVSSRPIARTRRGPPGRSRARASRPTGRAFRSNGRCRQSRSGRASCRRSRVRWTTPARPVPGRDVGCRLVGPRNNSIAVAITYSATASALAPVAGMTRCRARACGNVDVVQSDAEPPHDIQLRRTRAASHRRACGCARSARRQLNCTCKSCRTVDQCSVVKTSKPAPSDSHRRFIHEFADDDHGVNSVWPGLTREKRTGCSPS